MSAVKTGIPAALASSIAGPIDANRTGRARWPPPADDEVLHLVLLPGHVELAADHHHLVAELAGVRGSVSAITLKKGLVSVSTETPIVPRCLGGVVR